MACINCDTYTYHKVLTSVNEYDNDPFWGLHWSDHEIVLCQGCRTISFRKAWGTDEEVGETEEGPVYDESQSLFPGRIRGRKELQYLYDLPTDIQKIYKETHKALSSDQPILSGMGIRALVEAVCTEKQAKGKDLKQKIDDLVNIGVLTKEGAEVLHHTRLYGNKAAHEIAAMKETDLGVLMDIAENLLKNVYILPKKAAQLKPKNKDGIPF